MRRPEWEGELPSSLNTQAFREAWETWLEFRRDELRKPVTPISGKMSLKLLSRLGASRAIEAIEHTIANGWQGIREPDQPRAQSTPIPDTTRAMRELGL